MGLLWELHGGTRHERRDTVSRCSAPIKHPVEAHPVLSGAGAKSSNITSIKKDQHFYINSREVTTSRVPEWGGKMLFQSTHTSFSLSKKSHFPLERDCSPGCES